MAYKFFNITVLFLSLMIVGTIIASPVDHSKKNVENLLLNIVLDSMNNQHSNHSFLCGTLLNVEQVSVKDDSLMYNVSVLLVPDCDMCSRLKCHMLVKENVSSSDFTVYEQSKECYDYEEKKGPTEIDVNDQKIQKFVNEGRNKLDEYKTSDKPFITTMVNATKEDLSDKIKYVIYFTLVEPTCVTVEIRTSCSIQDDSLARLCTVIVEEQHKFKFTIRNIDATCEKEQHPLDALMQLVKKNNVL
ncbi:uncharacterized protein [Chelonus insularis]|uniref:uncharacterized protein n=1 Tax=Chelonus insularis TaxID=460826 RepID=UPI00158AFAEF|nr:uncharacterized protein LOC118067440 [Chelonus insularis]